MKRCMTSLIICAFILSLSSCGNKNDNADSNNSRSQVSERIDSSDSIVEKNELSDDTLSFGFLYPSVFSNYLSNGIFRCGTDFEEGDYYIMSISDAATKYGVSDKNDSFGNYEERVIRNVHIKEGQYVNLDYLCLLIPAKELDLTKLNDYGIYHVGDDIPAGEYKIETITNHYEFEQQSIDGVRGGYQINDDFFEKEPVKCETLYKSQSYFNVADGQYLIINNAKLTLIDEAESNGDTKEITNETDTEKYYNLAVELTLDDCTVDALGLYKYNDFTFLEEDCDLTFTRSLPAGAFYNKLAKCLVGYYMGNSWESYAHYIIGYTPESKDEFGAMIDDLKEFIIDERNMWLVFDAIYNKLQTVSVVTSDVEDNKYTIVISDVTKCAEEMNISEEMLGYILGELHDGMADEISFDGKSCKIVWVDLKSNRNESNAETTTTTTSPPKEFDTTYYLFDYEQEIQLNSNISLYYAPDKESEELYSVNSGTILIAIGEMGDWYAVRFDNKVVFCEKSYAAFYTTTTTTTTTVTTVMPEWTEPETTWTETWVETNTEPELVYTY
ncbi:MAG: hypothetical protein IJ806_06320 [Ruminococcus sp.]|nr:hypothetical protein [Ruminococcus sp.]